MIPIFRQLACLVMCVTCALTYPITGHTADPENQTETATGTHKLITKSDALLETIATTGIRAKELKAEYPKAEGEDRQIAIHELLTTEEKLRQALGELQKNIERQNKEGLDTEELTKELKKELAAQSISLITEIKQVIDYMDETRKGRDELEPKDLLSLETKLTKVSIILDKLLNAFLVNTERMQSVGMDTVSDLQHLDKHLLERAERIKGRIVLTQENIEEVSTHLASALDDQKPELETRLAAYTERLKGNTDSLTATIRMMNNRGLEASEYSQLLIQSTGEITGDILDTEVALGLLQQWLGKGTEWLKENSAEIILKVILVLLILFFFKLLGNFIGRLVDRAISSSRLRFSKLLKDFFVSISSKLVLLLGVLIALSQLGIQLGPLLAGLGVAGFIIGFALQDTLSNFASGMMILVYRPFDVGDIIEAGGVTGKVSEMSLVSTTVLTFDNQKLVVPNNKIWGDVIRNVTAQEKRRVDMTFGIGYTDDIAHAEYVLTQIVIGHDRVLDDPEPVIKLHTLGESSVDFIVRPWVKTADYWDVYWDITRQVKERFDAEGISIPFPQRDVHILQEVTPNA